MASQKVRVLVVGCDDIGAVVAHNLERGQKAEVTAVLRSNYDTVIQKGFTIQSNEHGLVQGWRPTNVLNNVPKTSRAPRDQQFDYVVLCTKNMPDVPPSLCALIAPAMTWRLTDLVLIQKGINIELPFLERFGFVISGFSRHFPIEISPGVVKQHPDDILKIGAFTRHNQAREFPEAAAKRFLEIYTAGCKTKCGYSADAAYDRWRDLVYTASLNMMCAVRELAKEELQVEHWNIRIKVTSAMQEVINVALAVGYDLSIDVRLTIDQILRVKTKHVPSMLSDFENGNLVEYKNTVGEVVRLGKDHSVKTPVLSELYDACERYQDGRMQTESRF